MSALGWADLRMTLFRDRPELLTAFRRGERSALVEVYWAYVDRVERLIRGGWRTPSGDRAEPPRGADVADLVQETFARAFAQRARLGFDGLRDFGPYLATISRNLLVDWARRQGREISVDFNHDGFAGAAGETLDEVEAPWADAATVRVVEEYLAGLPPDLADVHRERYIHSRSQRDAAAALRISRQQLRTLEKRLRDGLRRRLARR
ncbi:MAG: family polymerase sigma factor [Myxococcales bacterium]|nr:family polymerase sigma factor [Myxococcales bacterium]